MIALNKIACEKKYVEYHTPESTAGVYKAGVGMTLTRKNIWRYQRQLVEDGHRLATAEEIVMAFATDAERNRKQDGWFRASKRFEHRVARVTQILATTKGYDK